VAGIITYQKLEDVVSDLLATWVVIININQLVIAMKTEEKLTNSESNPVKKPSVQYVISVSLGVLLILLLTISAYYGIFQNGF
jgi:hypothetical protein